MMEVPESSISKKVFNGTEYYFVETTYATEMYGMNFSSKVNLAVHIEDGWCYMFYFYGESNSPHYDEFVQLVKSVEYGDVGTSGAGVGIAVVIIITAAIVCVIVILKKKSKKRPATAATPKIAQPEILIDQDYIYCHHCGNKLPNDSLFCNICGTKMIKEG